MPPGSVVHADELRAAAGTSVRLLQLRGREALTLVQAKPVLSGLWLLSLAATLGIEFRWVAGGILEALAALVGWGGGWLMVGWMAQRGRRVTTHTTEIEHARGDALDLACHELCGGLTLARGYVSMLGEGALGALPKDAIAVLPRVAAGLADMDALIQRMLDTARLDEATFDLDLQRFDLCQAAADAVRKLFPTLSPRHTISFQAPEQEVWVLADPNGLAAILSNLLRNAAKYSPSGGLITCMVARSGTWSRVSVSDQGLGIEAEDLPRLFRRFGRIRSRDTHGIGGTGLGLYLSRELARRHGGDIEVASQIGDGSTFTLTLPASW